MEEDVLEAGKAARLGCRAAPREAARWQHGHGLFVEAELGGP
ncbi:hypothetical protein [Streptomyces sp. NPDC001348]